MINNKNIAILATMVTFLSVGGNASDSGSQYSDDEVESSKFITPMSVSFFDSASIEAFLEKAEDQRDGSLRRALQYVKKYGRVRQNDREIVINCLVKSNRLDDASDFLWYTLTSLDGCDKDIFNYYSKNIEGTGIEIKNPENKENKEKFKRVIIEFWKRPQPEGAKIDWVVPDAASW